MVPIQTRNTASADVTPAQASVSIFDDRAPEHSVIEVTTGNATRIMRMSQNATSKRMWREGRESVGVDMEDGRLL